MSVFNYIADIGGGNTPFVARIKLAQNIDVKKGTALYYNENNGTVSPTAGASGTLIGICAADYKAAADDLCPDFGCGYVYVTTSKNALYSVPAYIFKRVECSHMSTESLVTELPDDGAFASAGYTGARLVLVERGENSTHSLSVGYSAKITDISVQGSNIVLVTDTDFAGIDGDKIAFVPEFGFSQLLLDENGDTALTVIDDGDMTVFAADEKRYVVKFGRGI